MILSPIKIESLYSNEKRELQEFRLKFNEILFGWGPMAADPPSHCRALVRGSTEAPLRTIRARAHWPLCLATSGRVFVADPSTLGRHVAATCMLCMQTLCLWRGRATACRTLEPQTAVCSPKLENNGFLRE